MDVRECAVRACATGAKRHETFVKDAYLSGCGLAKGEDGAVDAAQHPRYHVRGSLSVHLGRAHMWPKDSVKGILHIRVPVGTALTLEDIASYTEPRGAPDEERGLRRLLLRERPQPDAGTQRRGCRQHDSSVGFGKFFGADSQ
jgi:hypothetical protein